VALAQTARVELTRAREALDHAVNARQQSQAEWEQKHQSHVQDAEQTLRDEQNRAVEEHRQLQEQLASVQSELEQERQSRQHETEQQRQQMEELTRDRDHWTARHAEAGALQDQFASV